MWIVTGGVILVCCRMFRPPEHREESFWTCTIEMSYTAGAWLGGRRVAD